MLGVVLFGMWAGGARPISGGTPSGLAGRKFLSTAVTQHGVPFPMVPGTRVMLDFTTNGQLFVTTGCNAVIGEVELSGSRITLSDVGITQRGCTADRLAQDRWLAALLATRPHWQLSGPHLRVSTDQVVIELTDRRVLDPDRPLEGTRWVATTLIGGNTKVATSAAAVRRVFVVFDQGWVTGSDGCQPLSGPATVSSTTIDFGSGPAAAAGGCADPAANELARLVRATLHGHVSYQIEADQLTLMGVDPDGLGVGLQLTAVP